MSERFGKIVKADDESQLALKELLAEDRARTKTTAVVLSIATVIAFVFILIASSKVKSSDGEIEELNARVSALQDVSTPKTGIRKGMIKVAIFYPNGEDNTFDMDYYSTKHMPMAATLFGDSLVAMSIDKGLANANPDLPLEYLAIGYFYFENMSSFQEAMGANSEKLRADVPNYTNIRPVLQVSEVVTVE